MKNKKPVVWVSAICLILVSVIAVSLMSNSKNNEQDLLLKNGTYYMLDKQNEKTINNIQIKDNTFTFSYDLLNSYYVYGNYKIEDNTLIATTNDGLYKYVFEIDGNELIFNKKESSPVKLIDDRSGVQVENGSVFKFNNIETATEFISKYDMNTSTEELYVTTSTFTPIVTSPILMSDDSIGAAVLLDYADDKKIVFHGYFGLFIYDLTTEKITFHADLTSAIGINYVQGDNYVEVLVSGDGKTIMAYPNDTLGNYENVTALYVDIETGEYEFRKYEPMDITLELFDSSLLQGATISELKYVTNDREYLLFDGFELY